MEKISHIVRGSSRVSSADAKGSSAVRPGAPSYGRPIGESPQPSMQTESTAARAVALHNEMLDAKRARSQDHVVTALADQFFMSRIRRPEDEVALQPQTQQLQAPRKGAAKALAEAAEEQPDEEQMVSAERDSAEAAQPSGYVPRGSYVNVHA